MGWLSKIFGGPEERLRAAASEMGARYYGSRGTVHGTEHVDVELDEGGAVVAVWFRCAVIPFKQRKVGAARARDMRRAYHQHPPSGVRGLVLGDEKGEP